MKSIIRLLSLPLLLVTVALSGMYAEASEAGESDELRAAFQREYAYLLSLREGLTKQKSEIDASLRSKVRKLEDQINSTQLSVAQMTATTDERLQQANDLEKRLRSGGGATAFESALRDARSRVHEMKLRTQARLPDRKAPKVSAEVDGFESFLQIIAEGLEVAETLSSSRQIATSFLDEKGQPVQASVVLWGGIGAYGQWNDRSYVLAPEGSGRLKIVTSDDSQTAAALLQNHPGPNVGAYVFRTLSERADLSGHLNLAERTAGYLPAVYLILIALTVGWLFIGLARV